MATNPTVQYDPQPPYAVEIDPTIGAGLTVGYQSITFDPRRIGLSFEELRLQHYNASNLTDKPYGGLLWDQSAIGTGKEFGYVIAGAPLAMTGSASSKSLRVGEDQMRSFRGGMIKFKVGEESFEEFLIHEGVVAPRSEFVRLALRGEWKEATSRCIPLPEDSPAVFSVYQQWLYSDCIRTASADACSTVTDATFNGLNEYELLVRAYIFGDKMIDGDFKDAVIDAIVDKFCAQTVFNIKLSNLVFCNTVPGSPLRTLWMDIYYRSGRPEWLDEAFVGDKVSDSFLVEFSRYQMLQRPGFNRSVKNGPCRYHSHGTDLCYRQIMR